MNTFLPSRMAGEAPRRRVRRWLSPRSRPICPILNRKTFLPPRRAGAVLRARRHGLPRAALAPSTAPAPLCAHVPVDQRAVLAQRVTRGQSANAGAPPAPVLGQRTR